MKALKLTLCLIGIVFCANAQNNDNAKGTLNGSSNKGAKEILVIIDGNKIREGGMQAATDISPNRIESINVYKDSVAVAKYGIDGANGVIEWKTKSGISNLVEKNNSKIIIGNKAPEKIIGSDSGKFLPLNIKPSTKKDLLYRSTDPKAKVLYLVDGVEVTDPFNIKSENIKSITVLKDSVAVKPYGTKAKNGVVFITTKSNLK